MLNANEILRLHWNNVIPVNPISIANSVGLLVYKSDVMEHEGEFLFHDNIPSIVFKPSGKIEHDRFTIAHELGHYCLEHGPRKDMLETLYHAPHEPLEQSANMFAMELLMPTHVVEFAVKVSPLNTVDAISAYFQVYSSVMRTRLKQLDFLWAS